MIQDVSPSSLDNHFIPLDISDNDTAMIFDDEGKLFANLTDHNMSFPFAHEISHSDAVFLFKIDDIRYFLVSSANDHMPEKYSYYGLRQIRDLGKGKEVFIAFTAYHLWLWYRDNRFCGRCGAATVSHPKERALQCSKCGNIVYPRINPAVIVGVTNGDQLLITRYRHGYAHNALVAGFTEIGETVEDTVRREVMEETGLKVKNIRYYKSQPWGIAQDVLIGFYCEVDGSADIKMDESELKYAQWVNRKDIVLQPNDWSLTNEMMKTFKNGASVQSLSAGKTDTHKHRY